MNAITENVEIDTITDDDKGVLLIDFIAKLQKIVSQIPESSKMSARVEISPGSDCLDIYYTRPETDADRAERLARADQDRQRQVQEAYDRATYERLKAKFEKR